MEESKDQLRSIPVQRQHSVKPIIQKLKSSFATKFQNPIIERTSCSITNEVNSNLQVLHTLTKNIQDDLKANRLAHLSVCLEQIQDFTEYMVKLMSRTLTSLSETNNLLMKGRTSNLDNQTKICTVCFAQLEEVRLKTLQDKLESMNHFKKEKIPTKEELYKDQERLTFQEDGISAFQTILKELIMRKDTVSSINNDKTIEALQDFLKTILKDAQIMEVESTQQQQFLAKFKCGKEIVNQLYNQLAKNVKDIAKKDVMPLVLKLTQQFMQAQKQKIKKKLRNSSCQTEFLLETKKSIKKNSNSSIKNKEQTIEPPKSKRADCCASHRKTLTDQQDVNRLSLTNTILIEANQTRQSSFNKKNTQQNMTSLNCSHRVISNAASKTNERIDVSQKSIQVNFDESNAKQQKFFEQKSVQTIDIKELSSHKTINNARTLKTNSQAVSSTDLKNQTKNLLATLTGLKHQQKNQSPEQSKVQFFNSGNSEKRNSDSKESQTSNKVIDNIKTQNIILENEILNTDPTKAGGNQRLQLQTKAPTQKKNSKLKKKTKTKTMQNKENRLSSEDPSSITTPEVSRVVSIDELNLNSFKRQRQELAQINRVMSMYKKSQSQNILQEREMSMKNITYAISQQPKASETSGSDSILKIDQVRKSTNIEDFLRKIAEKMKELYPTNFGKKVEEILLYLVQNKEWVNRIDLAKILERLHPTKSKTLRHEGRLKSEHAEQSKQKLKAFKQKRNTSLIDEKQTSKSKNQSINELFKLPPKPFFISQVPHVALHKQSVLKLPNISKSQTQSLQRTPAASITALIQRIQVTHLPTFNLLKSDQVPQSPSASAHQGLIFRPRTRRDPYNNFTLQDLDLFGGLDGSYHFQSLFTKNSLKKRLVLGDSQLTTSSKLLALAVYNYLQTIWNSSRLRYQCIKSFLRHPYQTVCNDFVGLEVNEHMSLVALEEVFGVILSMHGQCGGEGVCTHVDAFLAKIGLARERKQ